MTPLNLWRAHPLLFGAVIAACAGAARPTLAAPEVDHGAPAIAASSALAEAAAGSTVAPELAAPRPPADPAWEVTVTPYVWFSGLKGDIGVSPRVAPVHVDLAFSDIWDALDFAGMAVVQARRERFVAIADIAYIDLGTSKHIGIRDPDLINAKLDSKLFISTVAAGYRAVDRGDFYVDLIGGARVMSMKTGLDLSGPNRTFSQNVSKTWADPVIGARVHGPIGAKWSYNAYGDVGGFGVSSNVTWQLYGAVQYRLNEDWTLSAGWRHLKTDYKHKGFVFDAAQDGPILGAAYRF